MFYRGVGVLRIGLVFLFGCWEYYIFCYEVYGNEMKGMMVDIGIVGI